MRASRVAFASACVLIIGSGGEALAAGHHPRSRPALARASRAQLSLARNAAWAAATSRGRRSGQRLISAERSILGLGGPPSFSFTGAGAGCSIYEGFGFVGVSSRGGGGGSSHAVPATSIRLNSSVATELIPAGNLDSQAGQDVLDYRLGASHGGIAAGVTARSGRTGKWLWARTFRGTGGGISIPYPEPDRVGAAGNPGVLLIEESLPIVLDHSATVSFGVQAVDGSGTLLWSKKLTGHITRRHGRETYTHIPILAGDIHDTSTPGHDLLIDVVSGSANRAGHDHGSDQPEVISAVDGSVALRGPAASSSVGIPQVVAAPDLNSDGLDDLAVIKAGAAGSIVAERGDTGAPIWASTDVPVGANAQIVPVGDLSGSGTQDLVVSNFGSGFGSASVSLVNGATGSLRWTHGGLCGFAIGRAGPQLEPAVGLVRRVGVGGGSRSSRASVEVSARSLTGNVVMHHTTSVTVRRPGTPRVSSGSGTVEINPLGDVQPDGAQDLMIRLSVRSGKHHKRTRGVVSGRNGHLIAGPIGFPTAGSVRHGGGIDLVRETAGKTGVALSTDDGASGTRYYRRHVAHTAGLRPGLAYGVRLTGHSCSDLVVSAAGKAGELTGLFTATGDPLWTVITSNPRELVGGHVLTATPPATYCVP